ncbi:hypothetical protein V1260_15010 [Brachybacterium sp. J144]|uniref:WXG100 family type VII secretion target n=1 Tax=Brachybacterium sp. J144 TaxID=3116487 RepID=UPI002E77C5FB|nr:hypothetical protein [Brachybacterium sp. J144]MEE1652089.1 hypothetical protein [Brachybacterium sp. J144]
MTFLGGDTDSMREHATHLRTTGARLGTLLAEANDAAQAVAWEGPDADALRGRCAQVALQGQGLGERLEKMSRELGGHADEQDRASEDLAGLLAGMLHGLGGLGGLLEGLLGGRPGIGAGAGIGAGLLGGSGGLPEIDGGMLANAAGRPVMEHDGGGSGSDRDSAKIGAPEDDFTHDPDANSGSTTVELPDGTVLELNDDGTGAVTLDGSPKIKAEVDLGNGVTVTTELEVGTDVKIQENPDGTITFTMTGTAAQSVTGAAEADMKGIGVGYETGSTVTTESVYSVTVPAGTSLAEAMQINPYDPSSIQPGTEVAFGSEVAAAANMEVSGKHRGFEAGLGVEASAATGDTTVIGRDASGTLSMTSGPYSELGLDSGMSVGTDLLGPEVKLSAGIQHTVRESVVEHVAFSNDAAGDRAFLEAVNGGGYPTDLDAPGVVDRYTETRTSTSMSNSVGFEIEDIIKAEHGGNNTFSDELIVRTRPDGTNEWAQQVIPHGEGSGNSVVATGGSERETDYQLTLGDVPADQVSAHTSAYWGESHDGGDLVIAFDAEELDVMRENRAAFHGDPEHYANDTDYLVAVAASASNQDAQMVVEDLVRDYNVTPTTSGTWQGGQQTHPTPETPGELR